MSLQSPTALLRQLKGAPLSVLIALLINRQTTGEKWIIAATGYSQNKVREALTHLSEIHLVTRAGRYEAWQLTQEGYQLPLGLDLVAGSSGPGQIYDTNQESQNLTLPALSSATTTDVVETLVTEGKAAEEERESHLLTLAANLQTLHSAGIMGKTADSLAHLPHISPEYIAFHVAKAHREGRPTGILICRLRDGDPAETLEDDERHSRRCYIEGPLAQFIEH